LRLHTVQIIGGPLRVGGGADYAAASPYPQQVTELHTAIRAIKPVRFNLAFA
jgi:hypothetical protein